MPKRPITESFIKQLKKEAKVLRTLSPGLSLQQAQNALAQREGYPHWNALLANRVEKIKAVARHDAHVFAYYEALPDILLAKILADPLLRKTRMGQKAVPGFEQACWDVWKNGYPQVSEGGYVEHLYLLSGLRTDAIMDHGNSLFDEADGLSPLVESAYWIAIANYWRSIYETTGDGRKRHPGFRGYMRDWVAGMVDKVDRSSQPDKKSLEALNLLATLYPRPDVLMIPPGIAHWGAGLLGEYEGRPSRTH